MNLAQVIGFLLIASLAGNGLLSCSLKASIKAQAAAEEQRDQAQAAAKSCSDGVSAMEAKAKEREAAAAEAMRKAADAARAAIQSAQRTLAMSASNPNDLCASSLVLSRQKIKERRP